MRRFGQLLSYPLRSGVTVAASQRGSGVKMLNMGELFQYPRIPSDANMTCVDIDAHDGDRYLLQPGDLMFARRSLTLEGAGKCAIVHDVTEPTTWESSIIRARLDPAQACPDYYFYYFASPIGRRQVETIVEQVAAAGIRLSELRELKVPTPPLGEQEAIVEVLGALDDKIAANHRLVVAGDSWLANRFALIARGTETANLSDLADVNVESAKPEPAGVLRYIDISSLREGGYDYPPLMSSDDAPGRARRVVRRGDTIWSTVRPNRRSHALLMDDDPSLIASTGLAVLHPKNGRAAGLYESARRPEFESYLTSVAEGSAYPAVRADRFKDAPVPKMPDADWTAFESSAWPVRSRMHAATAESRVLVTARDELLPLLMSGKVRVKDAEKIVEGAV